jgi:hypothetical protein
VNAHMQAILLALAEAPSDSVDPSTNPGRLAHSAARDLGIDSYKQCLIGLYEDGLIRASVQPSGTSEYGLIYPRGLTSDGWRVVEAIRAEVALARDLFNRRCRSAFNRKTPRRANINYAKSEWLARSRFLSASVSGSGSTSSPSASAASSSR